MKKGSVAMWLDPKACWLALGLLGLAAACARTENSKGGSGETHFLLDCSESCAGGLQCLRGVCTRRCEDEASCADLGADTTCVASGDDSTKVCDQLCERDRDCLVISSDHSCIVGVCRIAPVDVPGGAGGTSNAGAGGAGGSLTGLACSSGCAESRCALDVTGCKLAVACSNLDCGGVSVDDDACLRPQCTGDDACESDERCTPLPESSFAECLPSTDPCLCPQLPPYSDMCSPTRLVGPRGAWSSLTVTETRFTAVTERIFQSDGSVEINMSDSFDGSSSMMTAQLSAQDLSELEQLSNGPGLRPLLSDPEPCEPTEDFELGVRLELTTTTLEKEVTACPAPGDAVVDSLMDLARRY